MGAREQILATVCELADDGASIILISQEIEDLAQLADRVLVMRAGRIAGELSREEISEDHIIPLSMGAQRGPQDTATHQETKDLVR